MDPIEAASPLILWFRRDFRLDDHPALFAAAASGRPVIPVFIHDETVDGLGAAARWRLGLAVQAFADRLKAIGARLTLRRGPAAGVLERLLAETGAGAVWWTRYYEPAHIARDRAIKAALQARGIEARSFAGALLAEPAGLLTGEGRPYSVFTPFWRTLRARDPGPCLPAPVRLVAPDMPPPTEALADWDMGRRMDRGAAIVLPHLAVGEAAAHARLERFFGGPIRDYPEGRDYPARDATSGLSENLAWGEISPRRIWQRAMIDADGPFGAAVGKFLSELGWREFAWHLMTHHPGMARESWRPEWRAFPWQGESDKAERWRRAQTGEPLVDAGLREMYVTGRMLNRVRMVVASYLTKHLVTDWRIGLRWFADCLVDWDPAANALGWQWVAGTGPDAAPYFRIFNPVTQAEKFDPDGRYRRRFLAEGQANPQVEARGWFHAVPRSWGLVLGAPYPDRMIAPAAGRAAALAAYEGFRSAAKTKPLPKFTGF